MPPPTSSQKPAKAVGKDAAVKTPAAATNGAKETSAGSEEKHSLTKPDQAKYNAEQDEINKEIAAVKVKMVSSKCQWFIWLSLWSLEAEWLGCCQISNSAHSSSRRKRQEKPDQGRDGLVEGRARKLQIQPSKDI
jgi:hypothetical protein